MVASSPASTPFIGSRHRSTLSSWCAPTRCGLAKSEGAAMRNPPAAVADSVADRERPKGILRLAQSSGDRYHVQALRLVLRAFDDRAMGARRRHGEARHAPTS